MPLGPQGQRRPADTVTAIVVAKIATGEIEEEKGLFKQFGAGKGPRGRETDAGTAVGYRSKRGNETLGINYG